MSASWLFGNDASFRVEELAKNLNKKSLENMDVFTDESRYCPAISFFTQLSETHQARCLSIVAEILCETRASPLVVENILLVRRQQLFSQRNEGGLESLGNQCDRFRIPERFEHISLLEEVVETFSNLGESFERKFRTLVLEILPIVSSNPFKRLREGGSGLSSHRYRGGVFLSVPFSKTIELDLLLNLSHEIGHQALIVYQCADPLILTNPSFKIFSAVRKVDRPAVLSFHALVAIASQVEALAALKALRPNWYDPSELHNRMERFRIDKDEAAAALGPLPMTLLGRQIFEECLAIVEKAKIQ